MPFESVADTQINVGRAQLDSSKRGSGSGILGLTNADKLKLSKAGIKNILEGTMANNRDAILSNDDLKALIKQGLDNSEIKLLFGETRVTDRDIDRIRKLLGPSTDNPFFKDLEDVREGNRRAKAARDQRKADIANIQPKQEPVNAGNFEVDEALRRAHGLDTPREVQDLTETILRAADGNPLDTSITEENRKARENQSLLEVMLGQFLQEDPGKQSTSGTKPTAKPSNKPAGKNTNKEPKQVTPEDMTSLTDSINTLSEKVSG